MRKAIEAILSGEVHVDLHYARSMGKGISDSALIEDKQSAIAVMRGIQRRLGVPKNYCNGYKKSEALVSLMNTPNNTFPVFWWTKTRDDSLWPAPFPRTGYAL